MIEQAYLDNYDVAVLISGDGDFDHAVRAVVRKGKHVENAYFREGRSRALRNSCSRFIEFDNAFLASCFMAKS